MFLSLQFKLFSNCTKTAIHPSGKKAVLSGVFCIPFVLAKNAEYSMCLVIINYRKDSFNEVQSLGNSKEFLFARRGQVSY